MKPLVRSLSIVAAALCTLVFLVVFSASRPQRGPSSAGGRVITQLPVDRLPIGSLLVITQLHGPFLYDGAPPWDRRRRIGPSEGRRTRALQASAGFPLCSIPDAFAPRCLSAAVSIQP